MSPASDIRPGQIRTYRGMNYEVMRERDDGRWVIKYQDGVCATMAPSLVKADPLVTVTWPTTTYAPIPSLSYCHTHGNTQDAGEWVDESGDECCESWFDQDDPARCVICDVYAKVPAT